MAGFERRQEAHAHIQVAPPSKNAAVAQPLSSIFQKHIYQTNHKNKNRRHSQNHKRIENQPESERSTATMEKLEGHPRGETAQR